MKRNSPWLVASVAAMTSSTTLATAQDAVEADPVHGRYEVNAEDPEGHLPPLEEASKHPLDYGYLLMELNERGIAAVRSKDYRTALKFHRAAAKMVPNRAISFTTVCTDYEKLGEREHAVAACSRALYLEGAKLDDYVRFVHLVASRAGGVDAKEATEAKAAIAHLKSDPTTRLAGFELQCELGLGARDASALSTCSTELRKQSPTNTRAIGFAWAGSLLRKDYAAASKLLQDAKRDGADAAPIERMEKTTEAAKRGELIDLTPTASASPAIEAPSEPNDRDEPPSAPTVGSPATTTSAALDLSPHHDQSMHPMLRWLMGLGAVLFVAVALARRFVRPV